MDENNNANKPYQPAQPAQNPWDQNPQQQHTNNQEHQAHQGHHEGHHPHHGHHNDHQNHQQHNPTFEPYQQPNHLAQPHPQEAYPTHIPPEVLEQHRQLTQATQPVAQYVDPTPALQSLQAEYVPSTPPASAQPFQKSSPADDINPVAVVQALSVRGVEYWMMTMTLYLGAAGLLGILLAIVNGGMTYEVLAFPIALLIVCLPIFSYLFLRLKKAELVNPKLKLDPSKRKLTQFTQFVTFTICLFDIIGSVFAILATVGGHGFGSLWKYLLNSIIVLLVAGGILYYYWNDEHRSQSKG